MLFQILNYDKYGDLKNDFSKIATIGWDYLRIGGCGQANVILKSKYNSQIDRSIKPSDEIRVYIDNKLRYSGKLQRRIRRVTVEDEEIALIFYGYVNELDDIIVDQTYAEQEISEVVKDILDNNIIGVKKITYDAADIESTDYTVQSVDFNHSCADAIRFLAELAGDVEWGVDRNKKFYFKRRERTVKRAYILGRDVADYLDEFKYEDVVNRVRVHGSNGLIVNNPSSQSISIFGERQKNLFESSIVEGSDANRLAAVTLKNKSKIQRNAKFQLLKQDEFIEEVTPLGAVAVQNATIQSLRKYSTFKYGPSTRSIDNRYGNLTNDQINEIRYNVIGGGLRIDVTLEDDIASAGTEQRKIEFEIKDLQRKT